MNNCNYCGEYLGMKNVYYEAKIKNIVFKYCKESCKENDVEFRNLAKTKDDAYLSFHLDLLTGKFMLDGDAE